MKPQFIALLILVVSFGVASAAGANEKSEAKKHFEEGFKLWKKQDFSAAATEFELSAKFYENKSNLYNLANCYMSLARSIDALTVFEKVLKNYGTDLDEEMKKDIEQRIQEINAMLAKLKVEVNRDGAVVKIDGKEVGSSPLSEPLVLMPGEHEVEITLEGREPIIKHITTVGGTEDKVIAAFEEPKVSLSVTANESGATVFLNGSNVGVTPLQTPLVLDPDTAYRVSVRKDGFQSKPQDVSCTEGEAKSIRFEMAAIPPPSVPKKSPIPSFLFWGGASGTGACAVAAGVLWGVGASKLGIYKDKADEINSGNFADTEEELKLRKDAGELKDQATHLNAAAVGMTIATSAFAVVTVVGIVMKKLEKESPDNSRVSVGPGRVEVRF